MLLKRCYDDGLAQAAWLLGCTATGQALVVDPNRDVERYVRAAEREGLRVTHVAETHVHADFVSGSRELARRTGAVLHLSGEGGDDWTYAFPDDEDRAAGVSAVLLRDGDSFMVGRVRIDVLHTPGHTPEHLTLLVTDTPDADRPMGAFTGDFVFVGDVGRPDLLERAAGRAGTMEDAARTLFRSLQRLREQPDWLQLWPGHGAGSPCGRSLGAMPSSTLGYETRFNHAFAVAEEDRFARDILAGQPDPPPYFARLKELNRDGPALLHGFRRPPRVDGARLPALLASGATVVDMRAADDYAARHVPGTISVPLGRSFATWVGWLAPFDRDLHLIAPDARGEDVDAAVRDLALIGLDRVAGYFHADALATWVAAGRTLATIPHVRPGELAAALDAGHVRGGELVVLDVRTAQEHAEAHLPGAVNVPLGELQARAGELPRDRPIAVHCQTGVRSAIASSVLDAAGFDDVRDVTGGFDRWRDEGHPVERQQPARDEAAPAA